MDYHYNFRYIIENLLDLELEQCIPFYINNDFFKKITNSDLDSETGFLISQIIIDVLSEKQESSFFVNRGTPPNYMLEYMGSMFFLYAWEGNDWFGETAFISSLKVKLKKNGFNIDEDFLEGKYSLDDLDPEKSIKNFRKYLFEGILLKNIENCILIFQRMIYIPKEKISLNRIHSRYSGDSYIYKQKDDLLQNPSSGLFYDHGQKLFDKWREKFGITSFKFEDIEGSAFKLSIDTGSGEMNIADVGYGIGQIATLIYILFSIKESHHYEKEKKYLNKDIIIIEEPEAGLHPDLQSKLADFFVEIQQEFGFQFIIETHSEYFIRKLQLLTAQNKIKPEDTIIHYLFPPNHEHNRKTKEQLRTIRIMKDGRLDKEFGTGFLDESLNLMLSILTGENIN
jgi:hypothetical protein